MRHKIFSILSILVFGFGLVSVVPAYAAQNTPNTNGNFFSSLVQFIAQKFGLDQNQVQTAVNDFAAQHKQQALQNMQNKEKSHLDTLVSKGQITSAEEQEILQEQAKLKSEYNPTDFKNLTPQERKQKMQQEQTEIQQWSTSTGIDGKYLRPGFGMGMRMGGRWQGKATPTPTP